MKRNDRYTLDRKRIVNARVSESEYRRLRTHAASRGVSLSFLMRTGLEPFITPSAPERSHESDAVETTEATNRS